jgi:hypothetical protein
MLGKALSWAAMNGWAIQAGGNLSCSQVHSQRLLLALLESGAKFLIHLIETLSVPGSKKGTSLEQEEPLWVLEWPWLSVTLDKSLLVCP